MAERLGAFQDGHALNTLEYFVRVGELVQSPEAHGTVEHVADPSEVSVVVHPDIAPVGIWCREAHDRA
jgi:hypothetical protein